MKRIAVLVLVVSAAVCASAVVATRLTPGEPAVSEPTVSTTPVMPPVKVWSPEKVSPDDAIELTKEPAAKMLFDEIRACFPDSDKKPNSLSGQALCYTDAIVRAGSTTTKPVDVLHAVRALVAVRPDVFSYCHEGGHTGAGAFMGRWWSNSLSYDEQVQYFTEIFAASQDVCMNGFIHGIYDALGKSSPGVNALKAASAACVQNPNPRIDCGHGFGHTAWLSTLDFAKAAEVCGLFPPPPSPESPGNSENLRYRCDDGVVMNIPTELAREDMRWSGDPSDEEFDPEWFYANAAKVCDSWPEVRADDEHPKMGCWFGVVGGLLFKPITLTMDSNNKDYWGSRDLLRKYATLAERACIELGPEGEKVCMAVWAEFVLFITTNEEKAIKDFCAALVKYEDQCVVDSLRLKESDQNWDNELSRQ